MFNLRQLGSVSLMFKWAVLIYSLQICRANATDGASKAWSNNVDSDADAGALAGHHST